MDPQVHQCQGSASTWQIKGIDSPTEVRNYVGEHALFVVSVNGPTLFGRDWLMHIKLKPLCGNCSKQSSHFAYWCFNLSGFKVKLSVKPGSKFCSPLCYNDRELKRKVLHIVKVLYIVIGPRPWLLFPKVMEVYIYEQNCKPSAWRLLMPTTTPRRYDVLFTWWLQVLQTWAYQQMILDEESHPLSLLAHKKVYIGIHVHQQCFKRQRTLSSRGYLK